MKRPTVRASWGTESLKLPGVVEDLPPRTNKTAFQNVRQAILRAKLVRELNRVL